MGHTNSTANLALPQFIGTDKPTWLGDVNGAFSAIDAYVGTNDAAVAAAASDASSAISQASAAVNTANTANTTAGNANTAANNAIGVANTANAIAGTVDSKVGLLADLNTTDRTSIVNAINEVNAKGGDIAELWINPDASQDFAAQNVDIITDLNIDTFLLDFGGIVAAVESSSDTKTANSLQIRNTGIIASFSRAATSSVISGGYRLAFTDCTERTLNTYGTAPATATVNAGMIPIRIFGIVHQQ